MITPSTLVGDYAADGYVVVESLFTDKECDTLKQEACEGPEKPRCC